MLTDFSSPTPFWPLVIKETGERGGSKYSSPVPGAEACWQGWLYQVWVLHWGASQGRVLTHIVVIHCSLLLSVVRKVGMCALAWGLSEMKREGMFAGLGLWA